MQLKEQIQKDLKEALKKREAKKASALRLLLASITNAEIQRGKKEEGLDQKEIEKIIKSEVKKRKEAFEAYEKAGRKESAAEENEELTVLESYLPEQLTDEEIEKIVKETMEEIGAESSQDFGKIMGAVMPKTNGRADGKRVSEIVKRLLNH